MTDIYKLNVKNNSTQSGSFCIFQELPDVNVPGITTLAWLAKVAHPTSNLEFEWGIDYSFVWSKTTNLEPGTIVKSSQSWSANLSTLNHVDFNFADGAYTFSNPSQGDYEGNLYIDQTKRVVSNDASVGIGMSGKGAFYVPSQPNMKVIFTPKPTYWLIFGNFEEGEVIDITKVTDNALRLQYKGTKVMNVELTGSNTWNVLPNN
ncbi:MAG: hypothetical protein R3E90_11230 [Marinicella sp.]|nr:hypothetical protein [Xanthomonadales bacterium]